MRLNLDALWLLRIFYGLQHLLVIVIFYTNLFHISRFDGTKPCFVRRESLWKFWADTVEVERDICKTQKKESRGARNRPFVQRVFWCKTIGS